MSFLEQRIETQMARFTQEVKQELRQHAADALAKREIEGKPVKVPGRARKQTQGDEQPAMRVSVG